MTIATRIMGLAVLVVLVGGCSSYSVVYAPADAEDTVIAGDYMDSIESGDNVRVTLSDEQRVEGKVTSATEESLEIQQDGPSRRKSDPFDDLSEDVLLPKEPQIAVISADEVKIVEKRVGSSGKTTLLVFGIVVGSIALMAVGIAASGGVMGGG